MSTDLSTFTASVEGCYPLAQGVVEYGGWRWATDYRMAVREPGADGPRPEGFPDLSSTFADVPWNECTKPLPALDGRLGYDQCDACPCWRCRACDGSGECQCPDCNQIHDCLHCEGAGYTLGTCGKCDSTGCRNYPADQRIEGLLFSGRFVERIHAAFPDARYMVAGDVQKPMLYFVAAPAVQGVLCGKKEQPR